MFFKNFKLSYDKTKKQYCAIVEVEFANFACKSSQNNARKYVENISEKVREMESAINFTYSDEREHFLKCVPQHCQIIKYKI